MNYLNSILEAVGNTPMIRLAKVVEPNSATILVKCEFMNPAGSIKDRMALHIINEAERTGALQPGGTIVENTSGNTGMGVALVAAVKGYRCIFTMPDKMSLEKINMLKSFGAEVVITPTDVPGDSPEHYVNVAKKIAESTPSAFYLNQYHNKLNTEAHKLLTGAEIWEQTSGKFEAFVAGVGTGGTTSGVGQFIKAKNQNIKVIGVDPFGSVHYDLFYHKKIIDPPHVYKVEGMGEDIPCDAMDFSVIDEIRKVNDEQCFVTARRLVREEGLFCGGSSGGNVFIAMQVARELGPGKTVVTVLPDSGTRYITKFLSDSWMRDNGFSPRNSLITGKVVDVVSYRKRNLITARAGDSVSNVIRIMEEEKISQLPIIDDDTRPIGIVHEIDLLRGLAAKRLELSSDISQITLPITDLIQLNADINGLFAIFERDRAAIVIDNTSCVVAVLTELDLVEYLAHSGNFFSERAK